MPDGGPVSEVAWLEPYPDAALEGIVDPAPGPEVRYEMGEAVQLAFVAAIQHLPPRQRAALLLHDVLGWSATETARLLAASVASVNSALQRARGTLEKRLPAGRPSRQPVSDDRQRALLERYVRAWESADVDGFVALLKEDAVVSMPPWREWLRGREALRAFFAWAWRADGHGPFHLVPTAANRQPAFAFYSRGRDGAGWRAHSIHLLSVDDDSIGALIFFLSPQLFVAFGLPLVLPAEGGTAPPAPPL
jgi:RNA polymerase sigma-70 factor (ECF subfamily)